MLALIQSFAWHMMGIGLAVGLGSYFLKKEKNETIGLTDEEKIHFVDLALFFTDLKVTRNEIEEYVTVTHANFSDTVEVYKLNIPFGLSFEALLKKQDVIENSLKRPILLINKDYNYFLIIENKSELKERYEFEVVPVSNKNELQITIGMMIDGPLVANLSSNLPHVLLGATSGSGKSRLVKSILLQIMENYDSSELQIAFLDNKGGVEGNTFKSCEHFECITNSVYETVDYLNNLKIEMEQRLIKIRQANVTNAIDYNKKNKDDKIPLKFVVIDELYPFLALKNKSAIYENIADLLSRGRAASIHFLISSQKTTTDVLPSFISANTSLIIGMKTRNAQESKNIISRDGLETITVKGRGICLSDHEIEFQAYWVDDQTIDRVCQKYRKKAIELTKTSTKITEFKKETKEKPNLLKSKLL